MEWNPRPHLLLLELHVAYFCRYITRAVLIPFSETGELSAVERNDADKDLKRAMKKAARSAGVMIAFGKDLTSPEASQQLSEVVKRVDFSLPNLQCQRIVMSYSWLLLATFKVSNTRRGDQA